MLYVTAATNLGSLFDVKQIEWTVPEQEMCQRHQGSVGSTHSHMIKPHVTIFISTILHAVRQNLVLLDAHSEPFLPNIREDFSHGSFDARSSAFPEHISMSNPEKLPSNPLGKIKWTFLMIEEVRINRITQREALTTVVANSMCLLPEPVILLLEPLCGVLATS